MEERKLIKIDPPNETRSTLSVANELVSLIQSEYKLTIFTITKMLHCDRQWVEDYILPNVNHINVNHFFMEYIFKNCKTLTKDEISAMKRGHYFLSEVDLRHFWKESAEAYRKADMIPVASLLASPSFLGMLNTEYDIHRKAPHTKREKERHLARMGELLTDEGYLLYLESRDAERFEWETVSLPPLPDVLPKLMIPSEYAAANAITNSTARKKLAAAGATKILFGGKTLWIAPPQYAEWRIPVRTRVSET